MNTEKLISVIVPVYNVEKYLVDCIESVLSQIGDETEVILIDDGSTDNSSKICAEYMKKYPNKIKTIHQRNAGLSAARNTGIKFANGKYLLFLDSDDFIFDNTMSHIRELLTKNSDVDVFMFEFYDYYDHNRYQISGVNKILNKGRHISDKNLLRKIFRNTQALWPVWKFIVRKDFIMRNKLKFKEGYFHEDIDWTTKILLNMKTFYYSDLSWYCYRSNRSGSIMNKKSLINFKHTIEIIIDLYKYIKRKTNNDLELEEIIFPRLSSSCFTQLNIYKHLPKNDKREFRFIITKNINIFSKSPLLRHRLFVLFCKTFGVRLGLRILSLVK